MKSAPAPSSDARPRQADGTMKGSGTHGKKKPAIKKAQKKEQTPGAEAAR